MDNFTLLKFCKVFQQKTIKKGLVAKHPQLSNIVKLGTDRGFRRGGRGIKGIWFCCPLAEFHIRHPTILKTFATFMDVSEISSENVLEKYEVFFVRFCNMDFVVLISVWDLWVLWYTLWGAAGIPATLGCGEHCTLYIVHSQKLPDGRTSPYYLCPQTRLTLISCFP